MTLIIYSEMIFVTLWRKLSIIWWKNEFEYRPIRFITQSDYECNWMNFYFIFFIFTIYNKMPKIWIKTFENEKPKEKWDDFLHRNKFNIKNSFITTWNIWHMFQVVTKEFFMMNLFQRRKSCYFSFGFSFSDVFIHLLGILL